MRRIELGMTRPPCQKCPKLPPGWFRRCSPEQAKEPWKYAADISDDVYAALKWYKRWRAINWQGYEPEDEWQPDIAEAVHDALETAERMLSARSIANELAPLIPVPGQK